MELTKDASSRNKILHRYSRQVYAKWIPATYVDDNDVVHVEYDWDIAEPYSGRWGIYSKGLKTGREYLIYIAETEDHKYRDISSFDLFILRRLDKYKWGMVHPERYNPSVDTTKRNNALIAKQDKSYREFVREGANDMWNYITDKVSIVKRGDIYDNETE